MKKSQQHFFRWPVVETRHRRGHTYHREGQICHIFTCGQVWRHAVEALVVFEAVLCWYQVVVEHRHEMNRHVDEVVVRHVVHRRLCAVYTRVCRHRSAPVASWMGDG